MIGDCSNCIKFKIKCVGAGENFPVGKGAKQAVKMIKAWTADSASRKPNVPPLDLSYLIPLVITTEAVAAQEAFERHRNPPKSLTDSFDLAMDIAKRARNSEGFASTLMSISNQAFSMCRLLLLYVTAEGSVLPSHPIERDYRNASILTSGMLVLSTILRRTSDLLDMGSFEDSSAMEQALQMILDCLIELGQTFEVAKQVAASDFNLDPLIGNATPLHVPVTVEREGVDKDVTSLKRFVTGFIHPAGREADNVTRPRHRWGTPVALQASR